MTIQQRILNAIEALVASDDLRLMVVVEFGDHLDCYCVDWVTIKKGENWSINSSELKTMCGTVNFELDSNITVELCRFHYCADGTVQIDNTVKQF